MAIENDFTINYSAKTVTHSSGTTVYTVLAFFQWLANEFAAAAQMDDDYAFVSDTPQVYRWVNGWDMGDETSYQFLKGGAIATSGYVPDTSGKLFANLYSIGSQFRDSMIYIIQNDAEISPWWIPGNIDILIKVDDSGLIDSGIVTVFSRDSDALYDHNEVNLSAGGRNPVGINTFEDINYKETGDIYLDVDTVANFDIGNFAYGATSGASGRIQYIDTGNTRLYLCQVEGTFETSETINERATRTGSNLDGTATNHATTAEFDVIRGYNDIKFAFVTRKFEGGTTSSGPFIVGETITQSGTSATFLFVGEVSDVLYVEDVSGSPNGTGALSGDTSGASYTPTSTSAQTIINKDLNNGAGLQPYNAVVDCAGRTVIQVYQYLKYISAHNSVSTVFGDEGEEYRSANEGVYTDAKQAPFGTFAGGTLFGARGIWLEDYAIASFSLIDANGGLQNPPNYKKVSVGHADLSGCQILVAERSGANIIKNQYTIDTVTTTTITVLTDINANKVPQSGTLRVGDWQATYTSFAGKVFSGVSPDPTGKTGDLYVPQLDVLADSVEELSDNLILTTAFDVKARVRKYGYKDYTMDTSFPTTGLVITPILAVDPQAT